MSEKLDNLRAEIAKKQAEIGKVAGQALSRREVQALCATYAQKWAARGEPRISQAITMAAAHGTLEHLDDYSNLENRWAVMFALVGPDVIAARLAERAAAIVPVGLDAEDRAARLAELGAQLDTLELAEEREVMRIEATGASIDRRPDARPEIVLALQDETQP